MSILGRRFSVFVGLLCVLLSQGLSSNNASNTMRMPKKVAVIGSTGQLGRRTINQLLARKIPVKCLIRQTTPPDFLTETQKAHPDLMEFVTGGDVTNPDTVKELLEGCSHCLALHGATRASKGFEVFSAAEGSEDSDPSHAKQVNCKSMELFVRFAQETECEHIVRITGKGEDPWSFIAVLINGLGSMAKGWNYEGEQVLRQQPKGNKRHLDYTIIRPGLMKPDFDHKAAKQHLELADNGGVLKTSTVSYDQIAELCIESLLQPEARDTTLTAMNVDDADGVELTVVERLKKVRKDSRQFPPSLIAEHKRAVKTVSTSLAAGFLAIVVGILLLVF